MKPKSLAAWFFGVYGLSTFNAILQIVRLLCVAWIFTNYGHSIVNFSAKTVIDAATNTTATYYHDNVHYFCKTFGGNTSCPSYDNYTPSAVPFHGRLSGYVTDRLVAPMKPHVWEWIYNVCWALTNSAVICFMIYEVALSSYHYLDRVLTAHFGKSASLNAGQTVCTILLDVVWLIGTALVQSLLAVAFAAPNGFGSLVACLRNPWCGVGCRISKKFGHYWITRVIRLFFDGGDPSTTASLSNFHVLFRDIYARVDQKMKDSYQQRFFARRAHELRRNLSRANIHQVCSIDGEPYVPVTVTLRNDLVDWELSDDQHNLLAKASHLLLRRADLLSNGYGAEIGVRILIEGNGSDVYSKKINFDTKLLAIFEHEFYVADANKVPELTTLKSLFTWDSPYAQQEEPELYDNRFLWSNPELVENTVSTRRFDPTAPAPSQPKDSLVTTRRFVPPSWSNKEREMSQKAEEEEADDSQAPDKMESMFMQFLESKFPRLADALHTSSPSTTNNSKTNSRENDDDYGEAPEPDQQQQDRQGRNVESRQNSSTTTRKKTPADNSKGSRSSSKGSNHSARSGKSDKSNKSSKSTKSNAKASASASAAASEGNSTATAKASASTQQRTPSNVSNKNGSKQPPSAPAKGPASNKPPCNMAPELPDGYMSGFPSGSASNNKFFFTEKDDTGKSQQFILSTRGLGPHHCWIAVSFLALRALAVNLRLIQPGASQFLVQLKNASWCAKEGLKNFKSLVETYFPGMLNQPFNPMDVILKLSRVFSVQKNKMLFETITISDKKNPKTPTVCRSAAQISFYELPNEGGHWTFCYNKQQSIGPASWMNAEQGFSVNEKQTPAAQTHTIWIRKGFDLAAPNVQSKTVATAAAKAATSDGTVAPSATQQPEAAPAEPLVETSDGTTVAPNTDTIVPQTEFHVAFAEVTGEATGKTIEVAKTTTPAPPPPPQPLTPSSFSHGRTELPSRGSSKNSRRTGPQGKGPAPVQVVEAGNASPETQRLLVQPRQELVSSSTPSPHSSSNNNRGEPSTPRSLSATSGPSSLGHALGLGSQVLASPDLLPGADLHGERTQAVGQVHDGLVRPGDRPHSVDHVEGRQDRLEQAGNPIPTGSSIGSNGSGHHQGGGALDGPGDQGLLDSHVAVLGTQGGHLSAQSGSSHLGPWEQPPPSQDHGGQGNSRETGSLRSGVGRVVPNLAQHHPATPQQAQASWPSVPLSPLAPDFVGSQQRSASRQSGAVLPLGASWSSPSNGQGGSQGGDSHGALGPQASGNSSSLPRLEPHQRKGSQGSSKRREESLLPTNGSSEEGSQNATTTLTFPLVAHDYTFVTALAGIQPSSQTILTGSTSTSLQKQKLLNERSVDDLPLHVKPLAYTINMDRLIALESKSDRNTPQRTVDAVVAAQEYLEEANVYATADLPERSQRSCSLARGLTSDDAELLIEAGIIEKVEDPASVRGRLVFFVIPEWQKDRKRGIQHTKDINDRLPPAPKVKFTTIAERKQFVNQGVCMAAVDFMAYYTQFPLSEEVRNYMCFRVPNDKTGRSDLVRLCRGPTGQSHMVFVSVAATNRILDYEHHNVIVDQHIDNVIFVGNSEQEIVEQLTILKQRCDHVGCTINESLDTLEDMKNLVKAEDDWCGIHYNFSNKTVSLTQKVVNKIDLSWSLKEGWTFRGFAAHMGLLFYSSAILETPLHQYFQLFRFLSEVSSAMQQSDHEDWNDPISVPPAALADLEAWTAFAFKNEPNHVAKPCSEYDSLLMTVDSCAEGWGYLAHDELTGETWCYGERWPQHLKSSIPHKLQASTWTEPRGIFNAKQHALAHVHSSNHPWKDVTRHFIIGNDNVAAIATLSRHHNKKSFDLNAIAARDYACFPQLPCSYVKISGKANWVADALSRPSTTKITMDDIMGFTVSDLRSLLGVRPGVGGAAAAGESG